MHVFDSRLVINAHISEEDDDEFELSSALSAYNLGVSYGTLTLLKLPERGWGFNFNPSPNPPSRCVQTVGLFGSISVPLCLGNIVISSQQQVLRTVILSPKFCISVLKKNLDFNRAYMQRVGL